MTSAAARVDLVVLSADLDIEFALQGVLSRHKALGVRPIQVRFYRHPGRDPGCRTNAHEYLRSFVNTFRHALVVFDLEGSGSETKHRTQIELEIESRLRDNGWNDRAAVVVISPEVEAWVWSDSPHVDRVCGWTDRTPSLREWLALNKFVATGQTKPSDPKRAFRDALRLVRKQPSAALFKELANTVSLTRCTDPSFEKLRETLQRWFPQTVE